MKHLNLKNTLKLVAAATLMALSTWASALELKPFSAAELGTLQQQGKPVAVHFHADWCPTCVKQSKSLDALKADAQLQDVTVLVANYDDEKELRKSMAVKKQSTIVVFKGAQEVGRLGGKTDAADIKAELAKAL